MNFEEFYLNTPDKLKVKYLDAIIKNNSALKSEFKSFVTQETGALVEGSLIAFKQTISETTSKYLKLFESVDTENPDWDHYRPPYDGYIEEWEAYQFASEQEFESIFSGFYSAATDKIIQQKPDELVAMLSGLFQAVKSADVADEVYSFEDVNEFLLEKFHETTDLLVEKLRLCAIANPSIVATFKLFFSYISEAVKLSVSELDYIEPVLITLVERSDSPEEISHMMFSHQIDQEILPVFSLLLSKLAGNQEKWLQTALNLYQKSETVARELLLFYRENDLAAFISLAKEVFKTPSSSWADFLAPYIKADMDQALYVSVFLTLLQSEQKLDYYKKIREYLSEGEYQSLINNIQYNTDFMVELYVFDGQHEKIKSLIETRSNLWNFSQLIEPLLIIYPDYCFQKIKNMTEKALNTERGRSIYKEIARWLVLAKKIPGQQHNTMQLIINTYNYKPNLPALKDEMRKAGVIKRD